MRDDARAARRLGIAARMLVLVLFPAAAFTGCRTASGAAPAALDPSLQATLASAEEQDMAALPDGTAKELVTGRCLLCHGASLITEQRKDAAAWGRTVTQMRTWGTPLQDEEQAAVVAYLAEHFGTGGPRR